MQSIKLDKQGAAVSGRVGPPLFFHLLGAKIRMSYSAFRWIISVNFRTIECDEIRNGFVRNCKQRCCFLFEFLETALKFNVNC